MHIKLCKCLISKSVCKWVLPKIGSRCCKTCKNTDCSYYCYNDRDKCNILVTVDTEKLPKQFRRVWSVYK